ncbi:MAG: bifunctional glycosyltransferase family 2/GtrA family protein [Patescibacteria group bacterium]|nr:bifunctional glycosyltransferase family 2/GtrA family protein [Patescibacteria group bacterium]
MKLSIIIPVYNEKGTLPVVLKKIVDVKLPGNITKEIIIIDDFSDEEIPFPTEHNGGKDTDFIVIRHSHNRGKGAAVRTGFKAARGDYAVIQDADLEYDPAEYPKLIAPLLDGQVDIVFGTRFQKGRPKGMSIKNYVANRILTCVSNILAGTSVTDMETCYKMMHRDVMKSLSSSLVSDRFGIEPEITSSVSGLRIAEVPIGYTGRTRKQGKKIGWSDGFEALWLIIRHNFPYRNSRILRYIVSGICGAMTDLVSLWFLTSICHIWYVTSTVMAFVLAFCVSFILQKFWTFRDRAINRMLRQSVAYAFIFIFNLGLNTLLVYIFVDFSAIHYLFAQVLAAAIIAIESYFMYRRFVFN